MTPELKELVDRWKISNLDLSDGELDDMANLLIAELSAAQEEIAALKREIEVLRQFGNKDCTAQADAYLRIK